MFKLVNEDELKYICLPPAQAVENNTEAGPAAEFDASDPSPKSAPASQDTVEVLIKPTEDSCSRNDCKAPQETENTHFALCLVHFLKSSGHLLCFSVTLGCLTEPTGYIFIFASKICV